MKYLYGLGSLLLIVCLQACHSYRYFPMRHTYHNLDSAGDFQVSVDAFLPLGVGFGGAYAFSNNFAFTAHGAYRNANSPSPNSFLSTTIIDNSSQSNAIGGGGGLIFFQNYTDVGVNAAFTYDYQHVNYRYVFDPSVYGTPNVEKATVDYHSFCFQPGVTLGDKLVTFNAGCGFVTVASRFSGYGSLLPEANDYYLDLFIEPGVAVTVGPAQMGMFLSGSPFHSASEFNGVQNYYQPPLNTYARFLIGRESFAWFRSLGKMKKFD